MPSLTSSDVSDSSCDSASDSCGFSIIDEELGSGSDSSGCPMDGEEMSDGPVGAREQSVGDRSSAGTEVIHLLHYSDRPQGQCGEGVGVQD